MPPFSRDLHVSDLMHDIRLRFDTLMRYDCFIYDFIIIVVIYELMYDNLVVGHKRMLANTGMLL